MNASTKVLESFFSDRLAGEEFVVCLPALYAQVPDEQPPEIPDDVPPELPRGEPTEDPELPQPQDAAHGKTLNAVGDDWSFVYTLD